MKNNKEMTRKTKDEKRRLSFEKRNVKKEQNRTRYGAEGGSALVMAKTTEFNRRIIAAVLALVFVLTTIVVGYNFAAKADDPDDGFKMFESIDDSGFVTRKGIKLNDKGTGDISDDTYDLRLEAYATAPIATKTIDSSKTPLDVVMVMDESSSMGTERDVWTGDYTGTTTSFNVADASDGTHYYMDGDDYYLVQYNGGYYYVLKSQCERMTDYYAIVDISDQMLKVYHLGEEVLSTRVVTGKDSTPTRVGFFSIYSKLDHTTMSGADYNIEVDNVLYFDGGIALHPMNRGEWDYTHDVHHAYGSHGCVNTPPEPMQKVYSLLNVGDRVFVQE